jgi:hypothetical protein
MAHIPTHIPIAKIITLLDDKFIVKEENEVDLNTRLKKFYGCFSFKFIREIELPFTIDRYNYYVGHYAELELSIAQSKVNEIASYFDMYCKGDLMKYGTIRVVSSIDRLHKNASPEGLNGITYCYPSRKETSFLDKGFGFYIDNTLCDNFGLLIDTFMHELVHAKMHIEGVIDLNNHGPKFLELCSVVCKDLGINIRVEEIELFLTGDDKLEIEIYAKEISNGVRCKNGRKKSLKQVKTKSTKSVNLQNVLKGNSL